MNRNLIFALMVIAVGGMAWVVTNNQGIKEKIVAYFEAGDADGIVAYCSDDFVLLMYDKQEYETKVTVKKSLYAFFEQYPPKTFKIRHYGKSEKKNAFYMIGILQTTEEVFRVTIMIDNDKIEDISIYFEKPIG
jgi:hypothetical protein